MNICSFFCNLHQGVPETNIAPARSHKKNMFSSTPAANNLPRAPSASSPPARLHRLAPSPPWRPPGSCCFPKDCDGPGRPTSPAAEPTRREVANLQGWQAGIPCLLDWLIFFWELQTCCWWKTEHGQSGLFEKGGPSELLKTHRLTHHTSTVSTLTIFKKTWRLKAHKPFNN